VFHQEPSNQEIYEFVLHQYHKLRFSPSVEVKTKQEKQNPKRKQREAIKELKRLKTSTKSQIALKLAYEEKKKVKKQKADDFKRLKQKRQFVFKQQKKKQKHRGR